MEKPNTDYDKLLKDLLKGLEGKNDHDLVRVMAERQAWMMRDFTAMQESFVKHTEVVSITLAEHSVRLARHDTIFKVVAWLIGVTIGGSGITSLILLGLGVFD